jgi:hypothetical protein
MQKPLLHDCSKSYKPEFPFYTKNAIFNMFVGKALTYKVDSRLRGNERSNPHPDEIVKNTPKR